MHMNTSVSCRQFIVATVACVLVAAPLLAAEKKGFSTEKSAAGVVVKYDGKPFTEYVTLSENKPILWPVVGPTGKEMTRRYPMDKVDGEQHDHPHHRSFYFGHQNINGFEFWHDSSSFEGLKAKPDAFKAKLAHLGVTKHREFKEVSATADKAVITVANDYIAFESGKKIMEDTRRFTFRADANSRSVDVEIDFHNSTSEPVVFADMKDAGFSLRLPTSMALTSKLGGKIINSETQTELIFSDTRSLRQFNVIALQIAFKRLGDMPKGKYAGLGEATERVFTEAIGLDIKPVTPELRAKFVETCNALAWCGAGRG